MRFDTDIVALSRIDQADERHRITTRRDIDDLTASIGRLGLMNPPLLREDGAGGYTIICGFRRVAACARLKMTRITVRIVRTGLTPRDEVIWAVADNSLQRPLNLIEVSKAVSMLSGVIRDPDLLKETATILGLPQNHVFLKKIEPLCRMPESVQNGLINGTISLNAAVELSAMGEEESTPLANFLNRLRFNQNKQKELIDLVKEISLRENQRVDAVLSDESLTRIVEDEKLDGNQKGTKIRTALKKRRFPEISKAEETFREQVKALKLGNNTKLRPPKFFEGTTFTLLLSFDHHDELITHRKRIDSLIHSPYMQTILG